MKNESNETDDFDFENKKIGLALSGGGYRASFFHLGVLANLAEKDLLKRISVISTVSGGSIIGALYFLKLRERFNQKGQLSHIDYIEIVQELEKDFNLGVSKNIRSKVFLHPLTELRAVFQSREKILAKLYCKYFYKTDLRMDQLNDSRLPKLIINATLLRNGGPWYFSQNDMGQYADSKIINSEGPVSYSDNPIYLKDAIAASSAVPGLFNYVKIRINSAAHKFVDGGAFDNLGLFSLQKESCEFFILSDGSRQLVEEELIPRKRISVLKRSYDASLELNKKMMLETCENYVHIHLKDNHPDIDQKVSAALSELRTDLNKFLPYERNSLSFFAYSLANKINFQSNVSITLHGDFVFKDNANATLMQTPTEKFKYALRNGRKLNHSSSKSFIQALIEMKLFITTFSLIFLLSIWYALLASFKVIPGNDLVIFSYFQTSMIIISAISLYSLVLTGLNDFKHYIDFAIGKLFHLVLSLLYLLAITTVFVVLLGLIIIGAIKIFT
ncbi:patatin-like phospholipase family protein [Paenibacillus sp. FSL H8-0259]|uniref:patatin-like phospholipase family protein n=1 Tax=Paenibacillus sp. FSL H8-0259 TaxID=1920423 RepID=UPI00096D331E|nr:patatin-like phospholipase family protein [Paenibacillus sp. FSL H8-0259]OMF29564.1 hypothetical protein BK132_10955 [Paenibacillus sp. FSL H8-0259]